MLLGTCLASMHPPCIPTRMCARVCAHSLARAHVHVHALLQHHHLLRPCLKHTGSGPAGNMGRWSRYKLYRALSDGKAKRFKRHDNTTPARAPRRALIFSGRLAAAWLACAWMDADAACLHASQPQMQRGAMAAKLLPWGSSAPQMALCPHMVRTHTYQLSYRLMQHGPYCSQVRTKVARTAAAPAAQARPRARWAWHAPMGWDAATCSDPV